MRVPYEALSAAGADLVVSWDSGAREADPEADTAALLRFDSRLFHDFAEALYPVPVSFA